MIKRSALPLSRRPSGVARVLAYETYPAHVEGSASGGKCRLRKAVLEIAPLLREILRGVPDMLLHFLNALVGHLSREQSHGERCYRGAFLIKDWGGHAQQSRVVLAVDHRHVERARAASSMTSGPRRCSQRSRDTSEATDAVNLPEAGCRYLWRLLNFAPSEAGK